MSTKNSYIFVLNKANYLIKNKYGFFSLKYLVTLCSLFTIFNQIDAQNSLKDYVSPALKTVQLHRNDWPLSYPIIRLGSDQTLVLSFDEPGSQIKDYYYTIVHCDAQWNPSPLMPTDYIQGVPVNPITDYSYSFNTTMDYVHYQLSFPNLSIRPLISGNYVLEVFEGPTGGKTVLRKRFYVNEPLVKIESYIRNRQSSATEPDYQEINFEIIHKGLSINNPVEEVTVTVMQNGRTDNVISGLRPRFFGADRMDFNFTRETEMEAGNEFRYLDIRSFRFYTDRVEEIVFEDPFYHVSVVPERPRFPSSYQYRQDLNGRYYIESDTRENPDTEGDYAFVHFRLFCDIPFISKRIYINGALTNWLLDSSSEMEYDPVINAYRTTLMLKQGYYNYQYVMVERGETRGEVFQLENSYYETENDYLILVYYRKQGKRTHRLIGAEVINSARSLQGSGK